MTASAATTIEGMISLDVALLHGIQRRQVQRANPSSSTDLLAEAAAPFPGGAPARARGSGQLKALIRPGWWRLVSAESPKASKENGTPAGGEWPTPAAEFGPQSPRPHPAFRAAGDQRP